MTERYGRGLLSGYLEMMRLQTARRYIQPEDHVLDLACNEGRLIDVLPPRTTYLGIDIAEKAIRIAREKHPDHQFMLADLSTALPTLSDKFDAVVMLAFLEHIAEPGALLKKVKSVLTPQGRIIISTPAPHGRKIHDFGAKLGLFSQEAADEHESFLGKGELHDIAQRAELKVQDYTTFLFGFNQMICLTAYD